MRGFHLIVSLGVIGLLIWLNRIGAGEAAAMYGGLTWTGWVSIALIGAAIGFLVLANDSARAIGLFRGRESKITPPANVRVLTETELKELRLDKYRGPAYPHPVIFPERCIGCQACVDACPHDVLAIVDGIASAVAPDLCMEDTACQAECPVNPKACIIINTTKDVRSLPTPTRDGSTYETNVPGCYIIGDVSGVPLIKNAVKEGAEVIAHIADELRSANPNTGVEFDVAIIGIGPGGASAAATAAESGLRYIAIEQGKTLSTIDLYPKGKYIFFKPDTKDWSGGIPAVGLGLSKAKYGAPDLGEDQEIYDAIGLDLEADARAAVSALHEGLINKIPAALHTEVSANLVEKIQNELKKGVASYLRSKGSDNWADLYRTHVTERHAEAFSALTVEVADRLQTKIPGDQRENILAVWLGTLAEKSVVINEDESCKAVKRDDSGDHFIVTTERGTDKTPCSYTARRVVISIGLRGAPNKLRLPNEDLRALIDGEQRQKVLYALSDPLEFRGKHVTVVGGGNVAVEAAVDLVAVREGNTIRPRDPADMNQVTILVRDYLAPTVKFANKLQLYQCVENGLIDLRLGVGIKEMRVDELVLENVATKEIADTVPNHYVFALIGGERPNRFLESIGITIK